MRLRSLAPVVLVPLLASAGCDGSTDTTIRWTEGETRTLVRSVEIVGTSPGGGTGTIRQVLTTKETAIEVVPRGRTTTKLVFDRVELEVAPQGVKEPFRYDSRKPDATGGGKDVAAVARGLAPMKHLVGGSLEVVQLPSGLVEKFDGIEELQAALLKAGPDEPLYRRGAALVTDPRCLQDALKPLIVMPPEGLREGDVQQFQDLRLMPETVGVPGYLYYKGTYRLAEEKDGVARVEMQAEVALDPYERLPPWPKGTEGGRQRLRLVKGTCKAWTKVRTETGVLEEAEHVTDLDLLFLRPDGKGEIPIPVKVTRRVAPAR